MRTIARACVLAFLCLALRAQVPEPVFGGGGGGGGNSSVSSQSLTDFTTVITSPTVLTIQSGSWRIGNTPYALSNTGLFTITDPVTVTTISTGSTTTLNATGTPNFSDAVTGQSINLYSFAGTGCSVLNTVAVLTKVSSTQITVPVNSTGCTYTASSGRAGANAGGTAEIWADSAGNVRLDMPTALGAIAYATNPNVVVNQSALPGAPAGGGGIPLYSVTITAGQFTALIDKRRLYSTQSLTSGRGISITPSGANFLIQTDADTPSLSSSNSLTGSWVATAATQTAPCRTGAGAPAGTGTLGDCYVNSSGASGQKLYISNGSSWEIQGSAANTVVQVGAVAQTANVNVGTSEISLFSLTLPRLPAGTCAYLWYQASNLTASANVTYTFYLGSASQALITSASGIIAHDIKICNQAGVQNAQNVMYTFRNGTMANPVTMAVNTAVSQNVEIRATSAAATQQVRVYGATLEAPQ